MIATLDPSSAPLLVPLAVCVVWAGLVFHRGLSSKRDPKSDP